MSCIKKSVFSTWTYPTEIISDSLGDVDIIDHEMFTLVSNLDNMTHTLHNFKYFSLYVFVRFGPKHILGFMIAVNNLAFNFHSHKCDPTFTTT